MNRDRRFKKIMLVSSTSSQEVERCLRSAAGEVVKATDGESAIQKVQHANFEMTVLVSTGRNMDLAETFFNLRDMNASMPIVIVDDQRDRQGFRLFEAEIIAHASGKATALRVEDLAAYLGLAPSHAPP